jgi:hypothetical protein
MCASLKTISIWSKAMNKLLSFTPEPFDNEQESQNLLPGGHEAEASEQEWEGYIGATRRGGRSFRAGPKPSGQRIPLSTARQPLKLSPNWARPGGIKPGGRLPYIRFPLYPLASGWPYPVYPERPWERPEPGGYSPPYQEPGEAPSEYVGWAQDCLNRLLGLQLPLDGILDPATRDAIRLFQERQGLPITGLIGPETGRALQSMCGSRVAEVSATPELEFEAGTADRWLLPEDVRAAGEAQRIRYDSPGAWANGRNCTGSHTLGARELGRFIRANFPGVSEVGGYNCRQNSANTSQTSVHGVGRALDIMIPVVRGRANSAVGDPIANWLVRNAADLGIQYVIWNRVAWNGSARSPKNRAYTGTNPHIDHIHAELNRNGAERKTPWFTRRTSINPPAPPTPAKSAPTLVKRESTPPGATLYVEIDLGIVDRLGIRVAPLTGIFLPNGYIPGASADIILYLHGHKGASTSREAIDQHWNSQRFPYRAFREGANASGRNVILVAPTLGAGSETGNLLKPGGLDGYLQQVLAALQAHGPWSAAPTLGNLVFACHSGGGWPMRQLAGGRGQALAQLRECWGFDCTYNAGDDSFWAGWARSRPKDKVYIYHVSGSQTSPRAESLRKMNIPNAIVLPSRDRRHDYVPIAHWQERIQGANFNARPGGNVKPGPIPPAPTPNPPPPAPANRPVPRDWTLAPSTERMAYVMRRLMQNYGFPENGAAGLVGNLLAESGVIPNRIEGSSSKTPMRAPDFNGRVTTFSAEQVMNRDRQRRLGPKLPGIGLAQWTTASRRSGLFLHRYGGRQLGAEILYHMDAQIDYLVKELKDRYPSIYTFLRNPRIALEAASDEVLYGFEVPGSIFDQVSKKRLPRNNSRVQQVFSVRRTYARQALSAYRKTL